MKMCQMGHAKGAKHTKATFISREVNLRAKIVNTCLWGSTRGIGDNACHITWNGVEVQCVAWISGHDAKKDWDSRMQSCQKNKKQ